MLFSYGGVAQLGERLNGIQEVMGSIPTISTSKNRYILWIIGTIYSGFAFSGTERVQIDRRLVVFALLYSKQFCYGNVKHCGEILQFIIQHGAVSRFNAADGLLRQAHIGKLQPNRQIIL